MTPIRQLAAEDVPLYRKLRMDSILCNGRTLITTPDEENAEPDEELKRLCDQHCVLVAFQDSNPVGMATLVRQKFARRYHVAEVMWVFVSPEKRRKGIARALMEKLEQCAVRMGIECLELRVVCDNTAAIEMYRHFGYREYGTLPRAVKFEDSYVDGLYMVKLL